MEWFYYILRYNENLTGAEDAGKKKGLAAGLCISFVWIVIFGAFALAFWYGNKLSREDGLSGGTILMVSHIFSH